jgi:hypothetical protein
MSSIHWNLLWFVLTTIVTVGSLGGAVVMAARSYARQRSGPVSDLRRDALEEAMEHQDRAHDRVRDGDRAHDAGRRAGEPPTPEARRRWAVRMSHRHHAAAQGQRFRSAH